MPKTELIDITKYLVSRESGEHYTTDGNIEYVNPANIERVTMDKEYFDRDDGSKISIICVHTNERNRLVLKISREEFITLFNIDIVEGN